jgi:hypothetical protein
MVVLGGRSREVVSIWLSSVAAIVGSPLMYCTFKIFHSQNSNLSCYVPYSLSFCSLGDSEHAIGGGINSCSSVALSLDVDVLHSPGSICPRSVGRSAQADATLISSDISKSIQG